MSTRKGGNTTGPADVAVDTVAGEDIQRVKLVNSALGSAAAADSATETTLAAASAKLPATLGQKTKAASLSVTLASDSDPLTVSGTVTTSGTVALSAGTNNIGDVDVLTLPNVTIGTMAALVAGSAAIGKLAANSGVDIGDVDVTSLPALVAGSALIGKVGIDQTTPGTTNAVAVVADATAGCDVFRSLDLDETEEDVKVTAGTLYGWYIVNRSAVPVYVKLYNATAANVTVGSTTPVMTFEVPGLAANHVGTNMAFAPGIKFGTAICAAATTGIADGDTGAPAANDVLVNFFYK